MTAAFVPTSQNLGEIYGQKKLFTLGLVFFGVGMVITILSPSVAVLVLGYSIIAGLAATPLVTVPWIIMGRLFEGWQKDVALLSLSTAAVAGSLVGPFVGGYIDTAAEWRWAFAPQIIIVIIILLMVRPVEETERRQDVVVDWAGGLLSFLGLAAVLVGVSLAAEYGWFTSRKLIQLGDFVVPTFGLSVAPILIAVGVVLLAVFAFYWRRQSKSDEKTSLWKVGLLRRRDFVTGLVTSSLYAIGTAGLTFTLYLFLQTALNLTSFATSLTVLPFNIAMIMVMLATFSLGQRIVPKYIIQFGLLVLGAGLLVLYNTLTPEISPLQLAPSLIVAGIGAGLVVGQMATLTLASAAPEEQGESSGLYNTLQDLGYCVGISIYGAVLIYMAAAGVINSVVDQVELNVDQAERQEMILIFEEELQTFSEEELVELISEQPQEIQQALTKIIPNAAVDAMQFTLLGIIFAVLLALITSFFLTRRKLPRV